MFLLSAAVVSITLNPTHSIPVDNGVEGDPEIECGPSSLTINFNTQNPFEGHVFVKGLYGQEGCRSSEGGSRVAGIELPFESCNVARSRSLNPLGVFVSTTVIITFHPQFITKVDRAFRIQCFYMEADKTVSQDLEVSMLTTAFQTQVVPMPVCRYEILDGPSGQAVRYALVGEAVYHKWTCDTETTNTFCMTVHSCYVDDGAGDRADLLDQSGCAQDRYLLRNLEYLTDLMAGQETHVFKYADRPTLFFQCQITITIKEPDAECPVPTCSEPDRGKRDISYNGKFPMPHLMDQTGGTLDVLTQLQTVDLESNSNNLALPGVLMHHHNDQSVPNGAASRDVSYLTQATTTTVSEEFDDNEYCLSQTGLLMMVLAISITIIAGVMSTFYLCVQRVKS